MPRGSRIVDADNVVHDVERFVIAYQGEAKEVGNAWVAEAGTVRQFWPPTTVLGNALVLTTDAAESRATGSVGEVPPKAICNFDCRTGLIWLGASLDVTEQHFVQAIGPAPRETGKFLWKFDIVSGNITDDPESPAGTWVDMMSEGTLGKKEYSLTNSQGVVSTETAEGTVSVALDDGAGNPQAGTEISKTINFIAEVKGTNLVWTTVPWVLSTIRVNEYAQTKLVISPRIFVTGDPAGYAGGYEGGVEVIREMYAANWNTSFTAQVDIVSGTINGDATGTPLPISSVLSWDVEAISVGDSQSAEVDVTISDGVDSVTKRVTLYAEQREEAATSSVDPDFTQFDNVQDYFIWLEGTGFEQTKAEIVFLSDGYVEAETAHDPQPDTFPQKWNALAGAVTDPENFEVRARWIRGNVTPAGSPLEVFLNLSTPRGWSLETLIDDITYLELNTFGVTLEIDVQEVGRPETRETKEVWLRNIVDVNWVPPGYVPP